MFDEIAMEKCLCWDLKTNYFLGFCREHTHNTSMEFVNEGDLEEAFQSLDDGEVHYAPEVRKYFCFASILRQDQSIFRQQSVHSGFFVKTIKYTLAMLSSHLGTVNETLALNMLL